MHKYALHILIQPSQNSQFLGDEKLVKMCVDKNLWLQIHAQIA